MPKRLPKHHVLKLRLFLWIAFAAAFLFLYHTQPGGWDDHFHTLVASSALLGYGVYLLLGAIRGFTLIPATNLLVLAIPVFPPWPLFTLTLAGILISSASIYGFAESLHLADHFETKHPEKVERVRAALQKSPTLIVAAWSFLPVVPTDLICYACGVMEISFGRFMLGVLVGEGAICAAYVFAGSTLASWGRQLIGF